MDRRISHQKLYVPIPLEYAVLISASAVEQYSAAQVPPSGDTHFDIAKALMSMSNPSYHSFAARPHTRPVDVTDLREALGMSSSSCKAPHNKGRKTDKSIRSRRRLGQ